MGHTVSVASTMTALSVATAMERSYDYPAESVQVPCSVIGYPELDQNVIFTSGKLQNTYPVYVLVGKASERAARDLISTYLHDIPPLLNAVTGGGIDYVNVDTAQLREVRVADGSYLAAVFSCSVMEAI